MKEFRIIATKYSICEADAVEVPNNAENASFDEVTSQSYALILSNVYGSFKIPALSLARIYPQSYAISSATCL
jgi:hypothetical protein